MTRLRPPACTCDPNHCLTTESWLLALQGRSHVPFRDSKLTRMLQPSLGGNARTAIITTLSSAAGAVENSRLALHFANAAKKVGGLQKLTLPFIVDAVHIRKTDVTAAHL